MAQYGIALLAGILIWWLSTGLVLKLCTLPRGGIDLALFGASVVAGAAVYGLIDSAWMVSAAGCYVAFLSALALWGWIEVTFLTGFLTGPRTAPCPPDAKGLRRFVLAMETLLYHELTILLLASLVVALTWDAPNQTGALAFLILAAMRISAKLNIFLGVPNLADEMMPQRLAYLKTYFRKRPFNIFFPVSMALATFAATILGKQALAASGSEATGFALLFTLMALAILEHLFMILPLHDAALWRWAAPKPVEKI